MQILTKICKTCGKEFHNHPCQTSGSRTWKDKTYCSIACCNKQKIKPKTTKKCCFCGKPIYVTNKAFDRKKYCSDKCKYIDYKRRYSGNKNPSWKGGNSSYGAIHNSVYKLYGKPIFCEVNKSHRSKKFEWANLSGKYSIERSDWKMMCQSCHKNYDLKYRKTNNVNSIIANAGIKLSPALKKLRK